MPVLRVHRTRSIGRLMTRNDHKYDTIPAFRCTVSRLILQATSTYRYLPAATMQPIAPKRSTHLPTGT